MRDGVEVENIEEMRLREGIDDAELREEVRGLAVGDLVKLTLLTAKKSFPGETLLVRITRIRGGAFRGKLVDRPASPALSGLRAGSPVAFTAAHIHSLPPKKRPRPTAPPG
jgi:hypothetical protein